MPRTFLPNTAPGQEEKSEREQDPFGLNDRLSEIDQRLDTLAQRIAPLYAGGGLLDPQSTITAYDDASPRAFIGQAAMIAEGGNVRIAKDNEFLVIHGIVPCYTYIVEADGNGTHTTLGGASGAFQAGITAGGNITIWMCNDETLTREEPLGSLNGRISIIGPGRGIHSGDTPDGTATAPITITASGGNTNMFTVDGTPVAGSGLFFQGIGLSTDATHGILESASATQLDTIELLNCVLDVGCILISDGSRSLNDTAIYVEGCKGDCTAIFISNVSAIGTPVQVILLDNRLSLTRWYDDSAQTAGGAPTDWTAIGGAYIIANGVSFEPGTLSDHHIQFSSMHIKYTGADELFGTPTSEQGEVLNLKFTALDIEFTQNSGVFGNFRNSTLLDYEGLFIDGVYGYPDDGGVPSGTFLTVGNTWIDIYIGDIYGKTWPTQYSGPPPTVGGLVSTIIRDVDGDTKIDVEESADEDTIRFDIAGTERMTLDSTKLDLLNGTYLDANDVQLPLIGSPTYTNVEQMNILFHSAGWFSGGTISKPGGVNIDVAAGTGAMRSSNSAVAQLLFFDWPASNGITIPIDSIRYIGVELNDPNDPQVVVRESDNFNHTTDFPLGTVVNEADTTLHVQNAPWEIGDHANAMIQRARGTMPIARDKEVGGIIFSETGTRNVAVTAGQLWRGLTAFVISALDTNPGGAANTFDEYSSQGKENTGTAAWPNTLYDNGAGGIGTLQPLGNNKWANLWWYIELDGELVMVYGTAQYTTQAQAELEALPSTLPNRLQVHGILAARFIFQKSAGTAAEILSAFDTTFTAAGVTDHGNLAGLAGDDHTTYFLADGTRAMSGDIDLDGNNLIDGGVIFLREQANADGDVGDQGQLWMKTGAPTEFMFTDDAGNDRTLIWSGGAFHDGFSDFVANEHFDKTGAFPSTWSDTDITGAQLETLSDTSDADALHGHSSLVAAHAILDGSVHNDSVADGVTAGSIIIGNDTPKWDELVISIPAANVRNVLGIDNGETVPSWKTALDATAPAALAAAASAGTSLIFSHRDHVHPYHASHGVTHNAVHGISKHTEHANWKVLYTDGAGDEQELSLGADGTFLQANGVAAAPTFAALVVGDIPYDDATSDPLIDGDAAADGTEGSPARKDHVHPKHHAKYTDAEAVTALEAEDPFDMAGVLNLAKNLNLAKANSANIDGNDEIAVPVVSWLYLTSAGAADNLNGIGAGSEGQLVFLTVVAGKDITLVHDGAVVAGEKLKINGEANVTLDEDHDFAVAIYDATATVWNVMVPGSGGVAAHAILDGSVHTDSVADGVTAGSIIIGNDTPKWDELVISIPAANVRNVLGIDNGETTPSWKTALDATNPADIAAAASPGTSLIFAHRDHVHDHPDIAADLHTVYFLASGGRAMSGDINLDGNNIDNGGVIFLKEQAAADGDVAGSGQIWVKSGAPNQLFFTDEDGTDVQLGAGGGGGGTHALWVPVQETAGTSTWPSSDANYAVAGLGSASADGIAYFSVRIPDDFVTLTKAVIMFRASGNGDLRYNVACNFDAAGVVRGTTEDTIAATDVAAADDTIQEIDLTAAMTGLAAQDILGIKFTREGSHANDTITQILVYGVSIEYTEA